MKVLHIHGTDASVGGGPIAMLRLGEAMRGAGVEFRVLSVSATRADSVGIPRVPFEGRLRRLCSRFGLNELHAVGSFKIPTLPAYREADLLHIHCLHGAFFNYLALPGLVRKKPAIYTLHDMWPFTGHCVYSLDCDRWKRGCGQCPYPDMPNEIKRDATWLEWRLKKWSYERSWLTIVAPSTWMYNLACESMLGRFPITHIPHGIDTRVYRPIDQEMSRAALGIPPGRKVLLYLVRRMNPNHKASFIKGADLLVRAIQQLPDSLRKESVLLLVGEGAESLMQHIEMPAVPLGFVSSDRLKALAYSAADVFVFPSRAENSPLVLLEAMACGTPTVAFNVGGVPDMVRPGVTGHLADPEDPKQLADGIVRLLEDHEHRFRLRQRCRQIAVEEYSFDLHVERHAALYRQVLHAGAA